MTFSLPTDPLSRQNTFAAALCLLLVPLWIPFDWVVDPDNFTLFCSLRLASVVWVLVGLLVYIGTHFPQRHYRAFSMWLYVGLIAAILPMCLLTEHKLPYYMGLSAVMYGASVLFIWPLPYLLTPMALTAAVIVGHEYDRAMDTSAVFTGIYLMLNVAMTSALAGWLTHQSHRQNQGLMRRLLDLSHTDALTGAYNRRALDQRLREEHARHVRSGSPLALLMIDVDHFKAYNDHYGHQQGDECLQKVAHCLEAATTRPSDFVARYGGEEFVITLPDTTLQGAQVVAQRVVELLNTDRIPHAHSATAPWVTVSIGIAAADDRSAEDLVSRADAAMYEAKQAGRNRWVLAAQARTLPPRPSA